MIGGICDAFGPRSRASRRATLRCLVLSASIAIAGCEPRKPIDCVNIANGEQLYDASLMEPSGAAFGFTASDRDGYTRNIPKSQAPWWKCRRVAL